MKPGRPEGRPALRMRWEKLLFLHWKWKAEEIQKTLPSGLTVDLFDGNAWLGVVPFFMRSVHPAGLFPVPWLSDFLEVNVRTYVRGPDGTPGVWFYSLACNQPLAVEIARRFFNLNYVHASMSATGDDPLDYACKRAGSTARFSYSPAKTGCLPASPGSLEHFLVERYVLFSANRKNQLFAGRVYHSPYCIAPALGAVTSFLPAALDGFDDPARPPDHALVALPVDVEAWPIRRCLS